MSASHIRAKQWVQGAKLILAAGLAAASVVLHAQTCSIPGAAGPQTVSANPNANFPGTASVAAGNTSITLGARTGAATDINAGDLLLIIQMQGATINSTQTNQYGDGGGDGTVQDNTGDAARGSGSAIAGTYEFAVATNTVGAGSGTVSLSAPLQNSYVNAAASATQGQQRFQVIRVPQYSSATLSGTIQAAPWDGTSGGVLVMDVAGELALGSATIDGAGRGFRGGGGVNQSAICTASAGAAACTDYRAPNANPARGAFKGEGIAGTPALVYSSAAVANSGSATGADGYPNGDRARGAPANAGGGGNQHNAGGGGGGNGGIGGFGGNTWNSSNTNFAGQRYGGFGGANGYNSAARIIMGGGGGAGDVGGNGSAPATAGAGGSGGALVMIRAGSVSGGGTINVNGAAGVALTSGTDGAGGGGAGGTVWISTATGSLPAGLTINANGGNGANSGPMGGGAETDGPGGGGGGGVLITNSSGATFNTNGGAAGTMINSSSVTCGTASANPQCFATAGGAGLRTSAAVPVGNTGVRPAAECLPDVRVTKTTNTPTIAASGAVTANYSILLQNFGGGARNVAAIDNALPPGWTLAAAPIYTYDPPLPVAANNLSSGAEATSTANGASFPLAATPLTVPANGSNALTWRQFFLAPLKNGAPSSVRIDMIVNIPATAAVGCYHNPAGFTFLDPTRLAAAATREVTTATNNGANRTGANYSANTTYASGAVSAVAGNNYNGLQAGPTGEDVCLQPDLSVTKTRTGTGTLAVGGTDTYTLVPRNNGRAIANLTYAADQANPIVNGGAGTVLTGGNVVVTDTIPAGLTIGTITPPAGWGCTVAGQLVTCTYTPPALPIAAATDIGTISIPVTATSAACPGPLSNTANVASTTAAYPESNSANNTSAAVSTPVSCQAALTISKTDTRTTVAVGNTVTYSIAVNNAGPAAADGTRVNDVPSAGLSSCTVTGCTASGGAVCPAAGNLPDLLTGAGVLVNTLPNGGGVTFSVNCSVSASGNE
jgi:mucin-19